MERIETIDLKTETEALEAGHGITLYTFDEYDRLMHYAHIVASTPKERADGYSGYFLTIFKGGGDMRRFAPDDGDDYPDLESTLASVKTIWPDTPIWWEHDGSVPGVDDGITFDELRGADMLAAARRRLEKRNAATWHRTGRRTGRQGRADHQTGRTGRHHSIVLRTVRGLHRRRGHPARRR